MESLPDAIVSYILSNLRNAKDVVCCNLVSKRWKESTPFITSLYFPRNVFETAKIIDNNNTDEIIFKTISRIVRLEELVVYCPFSAVGLASWLSICGISLRYLELRLDDLPDFENSSENSSSKLDCIGSAKKLESLSLWGVSMTQSPKWEVFHNLQNLELVEARLEDHTLVNALRLCPNLTRFVLRGCEGVRCISIDLKELEECRLDFCGSGDISVSITCPKLTTLEIKGCGWISVRETQHLRCLSIANTAGKVFLVDFGKLTALESLSMRGVQWCWDAISKMLQWATEVKHLYMKVEFTGDFEGLLPFPEIDLVDFFDSHPKLQTFDVHGAMFAALCQKNSLKNLDSGFLIPCLEEMVITVRSPLNAEQKMNTLESFVKYASNLKSMVIRILGMKSNHSSADDFFDEICKFTYKNQKIVRIA